ncbi:MAG: hypothetical protein JKY56_25155 [Kofleriaceae bacterium]|nr:hypothetical protein [Kofleriaceae bacterium]
MRIALTRRLGVSVFALAVSVIGCTPAWKQMPHDRVFQRTASPTLHAMPSRNITTGWWDLALYAGVLPLAKLVSPATYLKRLVDGPPALDTNAFGLVPDSPWFENRLGRKELSAADVSRGAIVHEGLAPGPLTIIAGKTSGVTPGMVIKDSRGVVWFAKFDPPASLELTTGAEIIASRLLHVAGYHVPEMHIESIAIERLVLSSDAKTRNKFNQQIGLTQKQLGVLLSQLNPDPKGRLRALIGRELPGKALGPFHYRGVRRDDPNDTIPHERRRSLRGLWVFNAWLGNHDTSDENTLDTFISDGRSLGYVRHYLLDFGDSLGATGARAKHLSEGYEHRVDWAEMGKRTLSFGLSYPYWLAVRRSPILAVGVFESEIFAPARWAPLVPNVAFDDATTRDTFWAASILARFTEAHIKAAVATAEYSDPRASEIIARVLRERQHKLLKYAFGDMLGVSEPVVEDNYKIRLTDLEVSSGLHKELTQYKWSVRWNRTRGRDVQLYRENTKTPVLDLREAIKRVLARDHRGLEQDPFFTIRMHRVGKAPGVSIHVRLVDDYVVVVGIERDID